MHNEVKRFTAQRYHRNGIGSDSGIVTSFRSRGGEDLIAVTLYPEMSVDALTPPTWFRAGDSEDERYAAWWVDTFARRTIVINPSDVSDTKRGGDTWGFEIANEYRRRQMAGEDVPAAGPGPDPALEWYRHVHADPAETARLIAENNAVTEAFLGLPNGTLS